MKLRALAGKDAKHSDYINANYVDVSSTSHLTLLKVYFSFFLFLKWKGCESEPLQLNSDLNEAIVRCERVIGSAKRLADSFV